MPTRQGVIFFFLLIAMLLGAINYNNSMAYMLTFMLGSLFMIAILHTYRNLAGLSVRGTRPEPVYAGSIARFPIVINNSNGNPRPAVMVTYFPKKERFWQTSTSYQSVRVSIPPDYIQRVLLPKPAEERGMLPLGRIRLSTCFPLGLFIAWSNITVNQYCTIYPKPSGIFRLPFLPRDDVIGLHGIQSGSDDFAGLKPYHPGDSIRSIAWKILARDQELLVKKFTGNETKELALRWDNLLHLKSFEERLSQLCRWVIEAEKQGIPYSLELPGKCTVTGLGHAHQCLCLEALAKFDLNLA